jgi:hypothetical protein
MYTVHMFHELIVYIEVYEFLQLRGAILSK